MMRLQKNVLDEILTKPDFGSLYYYIGEVALSIYGAIWEDSECDNKRLRSGNVFLTYEEAQESSKILMARIDREQNGITNHAEQMAEIFGLKLYEKFKIFDVINNTLLPDFFYFIDYDWSCPIVCKAIYKGSPTIYLNTDVLSKLVIGTYEVIKVNRD